MRFEPSADIEQIKAWALSDPYHFHQGQAQWWLGEGSLLAFCLTDTKGPLTYVRLDAEGEYVRIHTQFAPTSVVSKRRLVAGMIDAVETLIVYYRELDKKGLIFNSVNPSLVAFMSKLGFKSIGQSDYRLDFEETK
jgi:hypothetical protein